MCVFVLALTFTAQTGNTRSPGRGWLQFALRREDFFAQSLGLLD